MPETFCIELTPRSANTCSIDSNPSFSNFSYEIAKLNQASRETGSKSREMTSDLEGLEGTLKRIPVCSSSFVMLNLAEPSSVVAAVMLAAMMGATTSWYAYPPLSVRSLSNSSRRS